MAAFSYTSLDLSGKEQKGILEADSSRQDRQLLREKGLTPLQVDHATSSGNTSKSSFDKLATRRSFRSVTVTYSGTMSVVDRKSGTCCCP